MKKTTLLLVFLIGFGLVFAQTMTPEIQWTFDTDDIAFGQAAAGDIDGDGKLEIVFGCYRNDSTIYALNGEDGSLLWKYNAAVPFSHGCNDVAALIYDVNDDGNLEVIVPSSCNPKTFCFNGASGSLKWVCDTRGSDSPPTIAPIGENGRLKILHGQFGGYVICIDAKTGVKDWEIAVDTDSWIQTAPTILDINNDGDLDFVVATWNAVDYSENKVYAYRAHDQELLWTFDLDDVVYHGFAVGDLDGDGIEEIIFGCYNGTLYCLNSNDGSLKWSYSPSGVTYVGGPVQIADLDNDGQCEIIFTASYSVFALKSDGEPIWRYEIPNYGQSFRGSAIADINGDDKLDLVFGTLNGLLIGLEGPTGNLLFSMNLREEYGDSRFEIDQAPLIADFNQDGKLDVFVTGGHGEYPAIENGFGRAYMISLETQGNGPNWLMFQNDPWRRSNICAPTTTSLSENFKSKGEIKIYPNPFVDYINIELSLDKATLISGEITSILGTKVGIINPREIMSGNHLLEWKSEQKLSAGIYVCTLWIGEEQHSFKMIVE